MLAAALAPCSGCARPGGWSPRACPSARWPPRPASPTRPRAVPRGRRPAHRPRPPEAVRQAWGGGPAARRPDRPCRTGPPPSGPAPIRPGSLTGRSVNHGAEIGNWAGSHHRESDPDGPRPGSHPGRAGAPSRVAWDGDLAQWIRGPGVRPCGPSRAARALWARAAPLPRG